jgi:integrase
MASIDRPRGKPRVRWEDPDGTPHAKTCATEAAARDLLRQVQWCEDTGRIWKPEVLPEVPSLRRVFEAWTSYLHRRNLAPRTVDGLVEKGDAFLAWYEARHGAGAAPAHLSRTLLETYWDHVRTPATGRYIHRRGESTARKHIETIHLFWEWAAEREEYEAPGLDGKPIVPRARRMDLPKRPPTTDRPAPTWAEMDQAIAAATGWRRAAAVVMRATGLRVQQVMQLRWSDVDGDFLVIRGELGKMDQEREGRTIPLAPVLLAEWRAPRIAEWTDPTWIVPCPHEHRTMRARDMARIWSKTSARRAAWEGRPDHAFRAGFQTSLRADDVKREATEYLVGHALPGLDASYIEPIRAFRLVEAVAKVPPFEVPALPTAQRAVS